MYIFVKQFHVFYGECVQSPMVVFRKLEFDNSHSQQQE